MLSRWGRLAFGSTLSDDDAKEIERLKKASAELERRKAEGK